MEAARNALQQRLEQDSRNSHLLFAHAFYSAGCRDYAEALADLNQAISLDTTYMPAYYLRSVVRLKQFEMQQYKQHDAKSENRNMQSQMDYVLIFEDLNRAIELEENLAYLYYNRGCVRARMGQKNEAVADFNEAIRLSPSLGEAYYNRALLTIDSEMRNQAFSDLGKAGELGLYSAYSLIKHFRKSEAKRK